jgi:hypothetical protein
MNKEYKYPAWVWVIFGVVTILSILGSSFIALIWIAIFFAIKKDFTEMALKIKKDPLTPFFLVLFFGLLGYLGYYIYFSSVNKKLNKK